MALVTHTTASADDGLAAGDDFPMLCETCLGTNPYVRMVKLPPGSKLCKITGKSFQAFRWKPAGGRQKETIISYKVAKERNICQTCLNDMKYGVPAGIRDQLESAENSGLIVQTPQGLMLTEKGAGSAIGMTLQTLKKSQEKQQREGVVAFRNLVKLCSFWVAGTCTRVIGKTCPFRPCCGSFAFPELAGSKNKALGEALIERLKAEGPVEVMKTIDKETRSALADHRKGISQEDEIRARVDGSDSLSGKYLDRMNQKQLVKSIGVPPDSSVATLWVGGVEDSVAEDDLSSKLLEVAGEYESLRMVKQAKCAFVTYTSQSAAVAAGNKLFQSVEMGGKQLTVCWAKPKAKRSAGDGGPPAKKSRN
jgi:pre-mRNA-splicing factor RBM22/SLT11